MTISAVPPKTPPAAPPQPVSPRDEAKARTLGLTSATGLSSAPANPPCPGCPLPAGRRQSSHGVEGAADRVAMIFPAPPEVEGRLDDLTVGQPDGSVQGAGR
jgi:hypothetical protein